MMISRKPNFSQQVGRFAHIRKEVYNTLSQRKHTNLRQIFNGNIVAYYPPAFMPSYPQIFTEVQRGPVCSAAPGNLNYSLFIFTLAQEESLVSLTSSVKKTGHITIKILIETFLLAKIFPPHIKIILKPRLIQEAGLVAELS